MSDVETRHYHGRIQHDHPGGDLPHNHKLGDPAWDVNPLGRERSSGASSAFSFGTLLLVFGSLGLFVENNNHSACSSVLVQATAQGQCQEANTIWSIGILGLVLGIVGAILRGK